MKRDLQFEILRLIEQLKTNPDPIARAKAAELLGQLFEDLQDDSGKQV